MCLNGLCEAQVVPGERMSLQQDALYIVLSGARVLPLTCILFFLYGQGPVGA